MTPPTGEPSAAAVADLERALQQDPGNPEIAKLLGNAHKAAGNRERAADCYRQALRSAPDHLPSLYNLGLVLHEMNRLEEAEQTFHRARQLAPDDIEVLTHLGAIQCKRSRFADAAETLRLASRLAPEDPKLWFWLAIACGEMPEQLDESIRCLQRSIAIDPGFAEAHAQLGDALRRLGDPHKAREAYLKAIGLDGGSVDAIDGLGVIFMDEGRFADAAAHYRRAIQASPGVATHFNGLGCALTRDGKLAEAVMCFRKAIGLQPDYAGAHHNLGTALGLLGAADEALGCFETALRLKPADAAIRESVLYEKQRACDWTGLAELIDAQRRSVLQEPDAQISPFSLLSIPSTRAEQLQCARNFAARYARAAARDREKLAFRFDRGGKSRLTIGYLSADFHEHVTAYVMAELFELHDRSRYESIAFSYGPDDGSPMRARLTRSFEKFVDVAALPHAEAAAAIHAHGVDILVDLKGYTQHARTEITALRPAPVQVSYMGYPATMAADFVDYLVADRFVIPEDHAGDYGERLVLLPGSYYVNDRLRAVADTPTRRELGLPQDAFVFCCFNQTYKVLPQVFAVWMRLLSAHAGSVLWLLEGGPQSTQNLRREARRHGVDENRLVFAPKLPLDQHLGRLRSADLFVDTLPYNAHTTATDALWVGVPVLTCPGDTFVSRVAGSLLHAVGLPELITHTMADYEALALHLARSPAELKALREKLARNRTTTVLFDTTRFVHSLEQAYTTMWSHYLAGKQPQPFSV